MGLHELGAFDPVSARRYGFRLRLPERSFPQPSAQASFRLILRLEKTGAVEKAAAWKSPKAGLSPSAWKSRKSGGIPTFPTAPATTGKLSDFTPSRGIAELQQGRLVCCLSGQRPSSREISYSTTG